MHKILAPYGAPSDPDHFRSCYRDTHRNLTGTLPGLRATRHSFAIAPVEFGDGHFCVWSAAFGDAEAADAALRSSEGQAVAADVGNYASGGVTLVRYTDDAA